jgi:cytochrome c-type biogenesis protein CcmH/NrfG
MTTNTCPACGRAILEGAKFCPECGAKVPGAAASAPATSTSLRDTLIVVAAIVVVGAGYFVLKPATPKPEAPTQQQQMPSQGAGGAQHPPVTDPSSGQPMDMPMLSNLPADYNSLIATGNINMDSGNFPMAAECYRRALAIDGSSADVRTDYGACLHGMGLPQRAIEEFRKVLAQDNKHTICNFNLGVVFNELQQKDSARYYWKKYLELDPNGKAAETAKSFLKEIGG